MKKQTQEYLIKLREFWIANDVPNITDTNAEFLTDLIKKHQFRSMLEIGTANWYSSICFASALEEIGWHITSIEFSILSHNQAIENIWNAWVQDNITLIHGQALDIIPQFNDKSFDFIFIDWMKRRSKDFLELSIPKLKSWWIIVIDDVIKFSHKMIWLEEFLEENKLNYEIVKIDEDDGIMIIRF